MKAKEIRGCLCDACMAKVKQKIEVKSLTWNSSRSAVNLIKSQVRGGAKMLPRSAKFLMNNKTLIAKNGFGTVIGVVCLQLWNENTVELIANAVAEEYKGLGIGKLLVEKAINKACDFYPRPDCLFLCTTEVEFYEKQNFVISDSQGLTQKMQVDCKNCLHGPNGPGYGSCPEVIMRYHQGLNSLRSSSC